MRRCCDDFPDRRPLPRRRFVPVRPGIGELICEANELRTEAHEVWCKAKAKGYEMMDLGPTMVDGGRYGIKISVRVEFKTTDEVIELPGITIKH